MSKPNKTNDVLDRATRTVAAWPDWMRRREFLGKITEPTYPRHPLPWKVRMTTKHHSTRAAETLACVIDADGRFVAKCQSTAIAEFICFASCHAPDQAMKLIGETVEKERTP